jgi:hypothetical protein
MSRDVDRGARPGGNRAVASGNDYPTTIGAETVARE